MTKYKYPYKTIQNRPRIRKICISNINGLTYLIRNPFPNIIIKNDNYIIRSDNLLI